MRCFADIPDVLTMEIPAFEFIVPSLGIARNTIVLWTGADGDGKTFLVQAMALAAARGTEFLGMLCQKTPVLYIDLENPAYMVQNRMRLMAEEQQISGVRIWGIWNEQQPPQAGSELLLTIAKETRPLIMWIRSLLPQCGGERFDGNGRHHAVSASLRFLRVRRCHPAPSCKGGRFHGTTIISNSGRL